MPKNDLLDELIKFDRESARKLNQLLSITARHKRIYEGSKDPALAQLWLAVLEIYSRQEKIQKQIAELLAKEPTKLAVGETSSARLSKLLKKRTGKDELLETLENY